MWLPPPSPSLDRVPGFTAPPAGRISQKLPVGSPNPTFLNFDPGWGGSFPLEAHFKSKVPRKANAVLSPGWGVEWESWGSQDKV